MPPADNLEEKANNLTDNVDKWYTKVVLLNGKLSSQRRDRYEGVRLNGYR